VKEAGRWQYEDITKGKVEAAKNFMVQFQWQKVLS
jgi:hypothetical protein